MGLVRKIIEGDASAKTDLLLALESKKHKLLGLAEQYVLNCILGEGTEAFLAKAQENGETHARRPGTRVTDNPYPPGSDAYKRWEAGFLESKRSKEIA